MVTNFPHNKWPQLWMQEKQMQFHALLTWVSHSANFVTKNILKKNIIIKKGPDIRFYQWIVWVGCWFMRQLMFWSLQTLQNHPFSSPSTAKLLFGSYGSGSGSSFHSGSGSEPPVVLSTPSPTSCFRFSTAALHSILNKISGSVRPSCSRLPISMSVFSFELLMMLSAKLWSVFSIVAISSASTNARKSCMEGGILEQKTSVKFLTIPWLYGFSFLSYWYLKFSYVVWFVLIR